MDNGAYYDSYQPTQRTWGGWFLIALSVVTMLIVGGVAVTIYWHQYRPEEKKEENREKKRPRHDRVIELTTPNQQQQPTTINPIIFASSTPSIAISTPSTMSSTTQQQDFLDLDLDPIDIPPAGPSVYGWSPLPPE